MVTDYTRDEESILIDLILNSNPGKLLNSSLVTFGFPNVNVPSPDRNRDTVIVATSVPGRMYTGSQSFYYNRVALPKFVDPRLPNQTVFEITTEKTLVDLLPAINQRYKIKLTANRILDAQLPDFKAEGIYEKLVELKVTTDSQVYLDKLILTIMPKQLDLEKVVTKTDLNGLTYVPPV